MNRRNALNENVRTGQSDKCVERERERDERVCGREREGGRVATHTLESQTGFSYTMKYISVQSWRAECASSNNSSSSTH